MRFVLRHARRARLLAAVALQLATPRALAQSPASGWTLDQVVAAALRANPDIVTARLRADSAHGEQRIARALPNPALNSAPNQPWQYTVSLPLDITPQRFLRTGAAARGSEAALDDLADTQRQVVFAVRQAFFDVLLAERQRDLAAERRDIFRQLLQADSARLRSGDVPQRDVTKAELEEARAEADLLRAGAQVHATRLALQLLMGATAPDTALAVSGELVYRPVDVPLDSLTQIARLGRPDVRAARERVQQSEALQGLAKSLWIPVPELTYSYQHGGQFAPGDLFTNGSSWALGFGFTLPLLYWNGGEREKAQAGLEQARVGTRRLDAQVANDVATALDAFASARALAERYQSGLLERARGVLETARYAYQSGAISLLELLDAIQTWSDTRADYYNAVHDYWVGAYALSRATGRELVP